MLRAKLAVFALVCSVVWGCSSDGPTGSRENEKLPPVGQEVVATTSQQGRTTIKLTGGEQEYQIDYTLLDYDTRQPVQAVEIHAVALEEGVFLRTESPTRRYFATTQYIPYEAFQTGAALTGGDAVADASAGNLPVVTVIGLVVAVVNIGSAVYEYVTDPPGLEEVFSDDGTKEVCVTGDINDALAAMGAGGVRTVSGAIKVFGAPARIRGVTAINLGFTRLEVFSGAAIDAFAEIFDAITGVLDSDVQVFCWPTVQGKVIPVIRADITRRSTRFDVEQVQSQSYYPVFPTRNQITTSVGARWSGVPAFPVTMLVTPISCYPGWTCYDWIRTFNAPVNPVSQTFGCWASNPSARSGSMTFRVQLRDNNGVTTPPVTFNFRCGSSTDGGAISPGSASHSPGGSTGFVGPSDSIGTVALH